MHYFAYGSNMDIKRLRAREVSPQSRKRAALQAHELKFNKLVSSISLNGYANIVPRVGGIVEGVLCEITQSEIEKLDEHEGCFGPSNLRNHYDRMIVRVRLGDGSETDAETYIAAGGRTRVGLKPSREYLNCCLAGKDFLSDSYYRWLSSFETLA